MLRLLPQHRRDGNLQAVRFRRRAHLYPGWMTDLRHGWPFGERQALDRSPGQRAPRTRARRASRRTKTAVAGPVTGSLDIYRPVNYIRDVGRTSDARPRLLDATIELVWRESYGAVSVDAICERAGVKKGSFYHFFDSKSALVAEALTHHWETLRPSYDQIFSPTVAPLERLR